MQDINYISMFLNGNLLESQSITNQMYGSL